MALTAAEIRDRAAVELGLMQLNQSLQDQDRLRIEQGYAEVYADLEEEECAIWAFANSVPNSVSFWVIALVAYNCLGTYGVSEQRYNRIVSNAVIALNKIKKHTANAYVSQEGAVDF